MYCGSMISNWARYLFSDNLKLFLHSHIKFLMTMAISNTWFVKRDLSNGLVINVLLLPLDVTISCDSLRLGLHKVDDSPHSNRFATVWN